MDYEMRGLYKINDKKGIKGLTAMEHLVNIKSTV